MIPALAGLLAGCALALALRLRGLLRDPAAIAVLVAAIAAFYPVFAVEHGVGMTLHLAVAACFWAAAFLAYPTTWILSVLLIAHGAFDVTQIGTGPAPAWWPGFCGGIDIALGAAVWRA